MNPIMSPHPFCNMSHLSQQRYHKLYETYHDHNFKITTNFCTYQDNWVVLVCAKFCCDQTDMRENIDKFNEQNLKFDQNVICRMGAWYTGLGGSALWWRHNGRNGISNHQPHNCLLNHLFRRRSKKTSKLRVTGLCAGNSPGTGEFPTQMASNAENVSIWWRHHGTSVIDDSLNRLLSESIGQRKGSEFYSKSNYNCSIIQ